MFISSARLQLRSSTEDPTMVGNDKKSDDVSAWNVNGILETGTESANLAAPFYPSVAQRIAVWRTLTTETSGAPSECDSIVDHSAITAQMESPMSATNGFGESRITDESNQSFVDHLMAELTSSRKRNKKLALKLASVERQVQQMQIDQRLRDDRLESMVALRVADALSALVNDRSSETSDGASFVTDFHELSDLKNFQTQFGNSKLLSIDNCQSILSYIRDQGCQLPVLESQNQPDVRPSSIRPFTRDVGTEAKCDDEEKKKEEDGNNQSQLELALSNANRELIIENARLRESLEESELKLHNAEDESNRLRVQTENFKNRNVAQLEDENARLQADLDKLKRRNEQSETKWEREAYELRAKYQEADEEKFRLAEELQTLQRQFDRQQAEAGHNEELVNVSERAKLLAEENKQLMAKNEELKRLVTVLRRKLSAVNNGASTSK